MLDIVNSKSLFTKESNVHTCSTETRVSIRTSTMADIGIVIAPVMRSVTAMLHSKMLEGFCSSLLLFKATTTKMFRTVVTGAAVNITTTKIHGNVVLVKSQVRYGGFWQKYYEILAEVKS